MKKTLYWIKRLAARLAASLKRFPEALIMAFLTVSILIVQNHFHSSSNETNFLLTRISMILALGFPLALCLKVSTERFPLMPKIVKLSLSLAAFVGLALYYEFLIRDLSFVTTIRYTAFSIALYLAYLFIPYAFKRDQYELYLIKVLGDFFIALIFAVILGLGCLAILFSLTSLFGFDWGVAYVDIWLIILGIFAPAFFLAEVPSAKTNYQLSDFPPFFRILLLYIMIPMLTVYSAILYFYFGKILLTRAWPAGIISHLVLWYALVGVVVIFFITPLRQKEPWAKLFLLIFPRAVLPLLAMMFVSMGTRVHAYGFTENRCFVLLAGSWVTGCMIYLFTKKERSIMLPITLACLVILAVSGPWSVFAVSKASQNDRFNDILTHYRMIQNGSIQPNKSLPNSTKRELASIISYFQDNHRLRDLKLLPRDIRATDTQSILGFDPSEESMNSEEKMTSFSEDFLTGGEIFDTQGYDHMAYISHSFDADIFSTQPFKLAYSSDCTLTIIVHNRTVYSKNVADIVSRLFKTNHKDHSASPGCMTFLDRSGPVKVLYVFNRIDGSRAESGKYTFDYIDFYVFIKGEK